MASLIALILLSLFRLGDQDLNFPLPLRRCLVFSNILIMAVVIHWVRGPLFNDPSRILPVPFFLLLFPY